jgi:hypothetical protein
MADNPTQVPSSGTDHEIPLNVDTQQQGILDQTLGEVLKSNPQAQGMVMQAMHLSPDKFQQLLTMTNNNALMNTKIRDLFSNGVVQQALAQQGQNAQQLQVDPSQIQISPEQAAQIQAQGGENVIVQTAPQQQSSFMQKLKGWLGL